MKTHIRTIELLGLPGLSVSQAKSEKDRERDLRRWLKKNNIPSIVLPGKGSPKAWHISSLPAITQQHLAGQNLVEVGNHPLTKGDGSQQTDKGFGGGEITTCKISETEVQALAMRMIGLLNGLSVAEALWVLKEADTLILNTHRIDTGNLLFTEYLETLGRTSGQTQP